jgi:ribose 5-phosphate isomerase B
MCLGQRTVGEVTAEDALKTFLSTDFEGGRHQRRVDKLNKIGQ